VFTALSILAWAGMPFVIRTLINEIADTKQVDSLAWKLVLIYVLLRLIDEWFWRFAEYKMRSFKPQMVERIRLSLFASTLNKPHTFFVNSSSGRIGHWINQTTNTMNNFIDTTIWSVWPRSFGLLMSAVLLMFSHWSLAVLFFVWLITLFAFTVKRGRAYSKTVEKMSDAQSITSGRVVDAMTNNLSIRVFNSKNHEIATTKNEQYEILKHWRKAWGQHLITNIVKGHSVAIVAGIAMVLILKLYTAGEVSVGDIVLFIAYFNDASSSLWELSWQMDQYYNQAGTVNNALKNLTGCSNERVGQVVDRQKQPTTVDLSVKNLSFAYPEQPNEKVLDDISFDVKAGQKIGVVGHSGAGKSTLVGLLLGFYDPSAGKVFVNNWWKRVHLWCEN
jgi:ATP-binding cassette subfamily B protein